MANAVGIKSLGLSYHSFKLYDVTVSDNTVTTLVTAYAAMVDNWISDMEYLHKHRPSPLVVGLDCGSRPQFARGVRNSNPVATLQLCIGRNCLIFQLVHAKKIPTSLNKFLGNHDFTFVGVAIDEDASKLEKHNGLKVAKTVDLRDLATEYYGDQSVREMGLKRLAWKVLKVDMEKTKRVTLSNWEAYSLSLAQVQYGCVDAFASFEIARTI